jgi:hypothetical protein
MGKKKKCKNKAPKPVAVEQKKQKGKKGKKK